MNVLRVAGFKEVSRFWPTCLKNAAQAVLDAGLLKYFWCIVSGAVVPDAQRRLMGLLHGPIRSLAGGRMCFARLGDRASSTWFLERVERSNLAINPVLKPVPLEMPLKSSFDLMTGGGSAAEGQRALAQSGAKYQAMSQPQRLFGVASGC